MKDITKAPKARTNQWKFSDFDEQEREEAALSSLLRKKKALTPQNVELEIEALLEAEMKAEPLLFRESKANPQLHEMRKGLDLLNFEIKEHELLIRQKAAAAKKALNKPAKKKKTEATTKSPKAFAKKALYDANVDAKTKAKDKVKKEMKAAKKAAAGSKAVRINASSESYDDYSTVRTKRTPTGISAKRASMKARNDRYTPVEKEKKALKGYSDRHTTRPSSRAKKANVNFKETKVKREIIAKPLTREQRVKKLQKRVAKTRNPAAYH